MKHLLIIFLLSISGYSNATDLYPMCGPDGEISIPDTEGMYPVRNVRLNYPRSARSRGVSGYAIADFTVTSVGSVRDIKIVESFPTDIFNVAAIEGVKEFIFKPRVVNGVAVDTYHVQNRLQFVMSDNRTDSAIGKIKKLMAKGKVDKAKKYLAKMLLKYEESSEIDSYLRTLWYLQGNIELKENNRTEALVLLTKALNQCEDFCTLDSALIAAAAMTVGDIYANLGKWDVSSRYYSIAVSKSRKRSIVVNQLTDYATNQPATVYAFAKFAVASFQTGDWCNAKYGFKTAIGNGNQLEMKPPLRWLKGMEIAERKLLEDKAES